MRKFVFLLIHIIVLLPVLPDAGAQQTYYYTTADAGWNRAMDLFTKQKYGAALEKFDRLAEHQSDQTGLMSVYATYYAARCAMELFHKDAEARLFRFISAYPGNALVQQAILDMAFFQYRSKNYRKALTYFLQADKTSLPADRMSEYYFKLGYSYFMRKDYEHAKLAFYEIKDIRSEYTPPAIYYYAHIAYTEGSYQTALKEFRRLSDDENFAPVVPYYITQILYLQKDYDGIIAYAPAILAGAVPSRQAEISRFIGDAYFQKQQYQEALPYLEKYMATAKLTRNEHYEIGYCYYQTGHYEEAAKHLSRAAGPRDKLSQNSYYILAGCYLRLGNKQKAAVAFSSAAELDFDPDIREDALFNFAKLTYEISYAPFNEAVQALRKYIDTYPYSQRVNEAYRYLVMAYLNTKNYRLALESLDEIEHKTEELKRAYQRVAFYRGLELMKNGQYDDAVTLFNKSLQLPGYDPGITARAWYWLGEAWYRLDKPGEALPAYRRFILSPGAISRPEYSVAQYNLGYIWFNKKNYNEAEKWFRKFIAFDARASRKLIADAWNRLGDCAFVGRDYQQAVKYYSNAYDNGSYQPDYALFQRGFTYGLMKNPGAKIRELTKLISGFSESPYVDDALFERGLAYIDVNDATAAVKDFDEIVNSYSSSLYVPKALVQTGLIYFNTNRPQKAIAAYKQVLEKFPASPEARNALTGLRNVYVDMNDVESFFRFAEKLGSFADVSMAEKDSLFYTSGENLYMSGDCAKATQKLENYLEKFPGGIFRVNAHFYLAECERQAGDNGKALTHYQAVIHESRNVFTEPALLAAAAILYDRQDFAGALEDYVLLEKVAEAPANILTARLGMLRCSFALGNNASVITLGRSLLKTEGVTEEMAREATFKMAQAYLKEGNLDAALEQFRKTATEVSSLEGAESKYRVAGILYKQGKFDEAEKEINDFIDMSTPHPYWMARAFLLLSDLSLRKGDMIQARYTLQSILDYYENKTDGIIDEATKKLKDIGQFEKLQNAPAQEEMEIGFGRDTVPAADTLNKK
ncbi:MAG: tetratricopeptide repeat protein [Chlorobi bacterium]|nr:tetratricopeptide repeat protein [Chlorobiota bacterium]